MIISPQFGHGNFVASVVGAMFATLFAYVSLL